jgi:hypothetical protein
MPCSGFHNTVLCVQLQRSSWTERLESARLHLNRATAVFEGILDRVEMRWSVPDSKDLASPVNLAFS